MVETRHEVRVPPGFEQHIDWYSPERRKVCFTSSSGARGSSDLAV
ncbi:unnamed protein product [Brassica napus]|uniref:(rape) hypothetical protein n=1 Tax=Brassica napus TaxID=3708 RepID=A0A816IRT7_BRANA|nr:unnamed protein product [Brassica napus]